MRPRFPPHQLAETSPRSGGASFLIPLSSRKAVREAALFSISAGAVRALFGERNREGGMTRQHESERERETYERMEALFGDAPGPYDELLG
jgi:hypothetical protein